MVQIAHTANNGATWLAGWLVDGGNMVKWLDMVKCHLTQRLV